MAKTQEKQRHKTKKLDGAKISQSVFEKRKYIRSSI
jgi:hypothetical protein